MWKKTQIEVVKRNRTSLKTGSIIKPKGAYVSLAGGGQHLRDIKLFYYVWSGKIDAFLVKSVDDMKLES